MRPTSEQLDAVDKFTTGRNLRINAFAGTGKTSTLLQVASSTSRRGVYVAFNRAIADEAKRKFPANVRPSTLHGLAFGHMVRRYGDTKMTGTLNGGVVADKLRLKPQSFGGGIEASARGWGFLIAETVKRFCRSGRDGIAAHHVPLDGALAELEPAARGAVIEQVVKAANGLWARMVDPTDDIPLSHDGYLKVWVLSRPEIPGDFILLDEAQDLNGVALTLMRHQTAQLVTVGDRWQTIYEWRGARNGMTELDADHEARLTQSFRFGNAIAQNATGVLRVLGETVPLTGNPSITDKLGRLDEPAAIITRTNSRLIDEVVDALEGGLRPYIVGGVFEMLNFIEGAEKLMAGRRVEFPAELFGFGHWDEVVAASARNEGADLRRWVSIFNRHKPTALRRLLLGLPKSEVEGNLVLSTAHKAKGLEWQTARLTDDFLVRPIGAPAGHMNDAELRLVYVAATRAMSALDIPDELFAKLAKVAEHRAISKAMAA